MQSGHHVPCYYVIPAEAIVLTKCNLLRYKASLPIPGQEAVQGPEPEAQG